MAASQKIGLAIPNKEPDEPCTQNIGAVRAKKITTVSGSRSSISTPSMRRFKEMAKKVMATSSARQSSTGSPPQRNLAVPRSHVKPPVADDVQSHHHSHFSQTSIIAGTLNEVDDLTRHRSHHRASSSVSSHGRLPHYMTPRNMTSHGSLQPVEMKPSSHVRDYKPDSTSHVKPTLSEKSLQISKASSSKYRSLELCKDCQAYTMESVCYISNEGRIAASVVGGAFARCSHHYCKLPRYAAKLNYNPQSSSASSKKKLLSEKLSLRSCPTKSTTSVDGSEDHCSACSSNLTSVVEDDDQNASMSVANELELKCSQETKSQSPERGASFGIPSDDQALLVSTKVAQNHQTNGDMEYGTSCSTPAASCISSEVIDDEVSLNRAQDISSEVVDDEKFSLNRADVEELNDFRSFYYHGDNEYSCSEDGTEVTTTPRSLTQGALEEVSNADNKSVQPQKSTMARMRQKYLDSLKEQEAETVRLRKQEMMARKQAGDWMLDCHMEELLHRLAPDGEARVKVLVEAFETVMHQSDSEGSQTHHHD